jgi:ABC-type multidrug transport system ATPase subunit
MLKGLNEKGITIVVSTPYMDEAGLCDRVALIQGGQLLSIDTPAKIVQQFEHKLYAVRSNNMYKLILDLRSYENTFSVFPFGQYLHYIDKRTDFKTETISDFLKNSLHKNIEINRVSPNIEDCFIDLMRQ